jgi:hypothetical protein
MTTRQENFLRMVHTVNSILELHKSKWINVKRFALSATLLNDLENMMNTAAASTSTNVKGATKDKHTKADEAIELGAKLAKRASVYARDKKNMEMHENFRFSRKSLLAIHDAEALDKLRDVHKKITPIAGELADYGVLMADVQLLGKLIEEYDALLTRPRVLVTVRTTMNTSKLPELLGKMRTTLDDLDDLINLFDLTPFEDDYWNARKIIDLGRRGRKDDEGENPTPPAA